MITNQDRLRIATILFSLLLSLPQVVAATPSARVGEKGKECSSPVSLEEFRAFALLHSPLVGEIDREYADKLARALETEAVPNPELQAETTGFVGGGTDAAGSQHELSIAQPFRLSDLSVRGRVAELLRSTGSAEKRAKLLELTQQLTLQYFTLRTAERSHALLEDGAARAEAQMRAIHEGVKKGLLSSGDERLFEGEMYRLQAEALRVAAEVESLRGELSQRIGSPCLLQLESASSGETPSELPPLEELIRRAEQSPLSESGRIRAGLDLAREGERVASLDATPTITPYLTYQRTNDGGDFIGAGLTFPLPLWNRNEGEKTRAVAERRITEARSNYLQQGGLRTQIASLRSVTLAEEAQATLYRSRVVPAFAEALKAQQKLYTEGRGGVLEVWQMLRTFHEVQLRSLELELRAVAKKASLSLLIGEELPR